MWLLLGCALIFLVRAIRGREVVETLIAVVAIILWLLAVTGYGPPAAPPL